MKARALVDLIMRARGKSPDGSGGSCCEVTELNPWCSRLSESRDDGGGCASTPTPGTENCFAWQSECLSITWSN